MFKSTEALTSFYLPKLEKTFVIGIQASEI